MRTSSSSMMSSFMAIIPIILPTADAFVVLQHSALSSPIPSLLSSPSARFMESIRNPFDNEEAHLQNQAEAFDMMADMFSRNDRLPPDTAAVVEHIAVTFLDDILKHQSAAATTDNADMDMDRPIRLLDIGCGSGVLFRFILDHANSLGLNNVHITGIDVSERMIAYGTLHAKTVTKDANGDDPSKKHSAEAVCDDFVKYVQRNIDQPYDGVIANSCFANFWDPKGSIVAMANAVQSDGGIVCVAHPVGSKFVEGLYNLNPNVTPHLMPTQDQFNELIAAASQETNASGPLNSIQFFETITWHHNGRDLPLYYASAVQQAN